MIPGTIITCLRVVGFTVFFSLSLPLLHRYFNCGRQSSFLYLAGVVLALLLQVFSAPGDFFFFLNQLLLIFFLGCYLRSLLNIPLTGIFRIGSVSAFLLTPFFCFHGPGIFRYLYWGRIILAFSFGFFQFFSLGNVPGQLAQRRIRFWAGWVLFALAGGWSFRFFQLFGLPVLQLQPLGVLLPGLVLFILFQMENPLVCPDFRTGLIPRKQIKLLFRTYSRLNRSEEILLLQDKLIKVGALSTGILHELKNLFFTMETACSFGRQQRDSASREQCLDTLSDCISRGQVYAEKILERIRFPEERKQSLRLEKEFLRLLKVLRANYRSCGIEFLFNVESGLELFICPGDLEQVLLNLIGNAVNALQNSGKSEKKICLTACRKRGWIRVNVEDNGPGIPPAIREKIFEPAVSAENSTGMGLYIASLLVRRNGGAMECQPVGEGAVFSLLFPVGE